MSSTLQEGIATVNKAPRFDAAHAQTLLASWLPCALVNEHGVITQASAELGTFLPQVVGRDLSEALGLDALQLAALSASGLGVDGVYWTPTGERMPAVIHLVGELEPVGGKLVAILNCARFRCVETRRFETTPYTVMRVSQDGNVRFANAEAMKVLGVMQESVLGRPLISLFSSADAASITEHLAQCVATRQPRRLSVTIPKLGVNTDEPSELILTPDMAPQGTPYGALVVIESSAIQHVRDEIAKIALDPDNGTWREWLKQVVARVRQVIEFDHAIFGIYAENLTLYRAVAIYEEDSIVWPERWIKLPAGLVRATIESGSFWIGDLEAYVADHPEFRQSEVVTAYLNAKIKSSVTLIVNGKNMPTSAFSLCSRSARKFSDRDYKKLRELGIESVLLRCEREMEDESNVFAEEVKQRVAKAESLSDLSLGIVDSIREKFKWDFTALFRVDRHLHQFKLVRQAASDPALLEPADDGFVQDIDKGMLGDTLRHGDVRIIDNVDAADTEMYGYLRPNRATRSVMTIPIRLNSRVRWIFHAESMVTNGFRGPDRDAIVRLVGLIEEGLAQRMTAEVKACLMSESERGVLLVGMDGDVLEMNANAARMLGRECEKIDTPPRLSRYAFNEHARAVLEREVKATNRRIELKGEKDERRVVFATCLPIDDSFDSVLWFFTDVRKIAWSRDLRFLRETVSEVARQTRSPLSLASSLANQLQDFYGDDTTIQQNDWLDRAREACRRIPLEIGKADITFERLAEALSIRQMPMRRSEPMDLRACIKEVIDGLPDRDQGHIEYDPVEQPAVVVGDEGRLAFVVRSVVAYLIRRRADEDAVVVVALRREMLRGRAKVRLELRLEPDWQPGTNSTRQPGRQDPLQAACEEAREDASLGLETIRQIIRAHNARLETYPPDFPARDPASSLTRFTMRFPAAPPSQESEK